MKGLLLDENLPNRLRFPVALPIIYSTDLGNSVSDSDLWNYSKENGLVAIAFWIAAYAITFGIISDRARISSPQLAPIGTVTEAIPQKRQPSTANC